MRLKKRDAGEFVHRTRVLRSQSNQAITNIADALGIGAHDRDTCAPQIGGLGRQVVAVFV